MRKEEWNESLDHMDADLIEKYVEQKDQITQKGKPQSVWLRLGVIAACLALTVGVVMVVPMLRKEDHLINPPAHEVPSVSTEDHLINPPAHEVPSVSTMVSGDKITGKQEIIYGNAASDDAGVAEMAAPGFEIRTVIEAEVVEVLPDSYTDVSSGIQFHVAKLKVVDQIRGEGLPAEIFLRYPFYNTTIFEGYERFILSLDQIGIENYMLVNDTQKRVDYFSNMFEVRVVSDLGYGSVIAFNDGKVDESFWKKANYLTSRIPGASDWIKNLLDDPDENQYPASYNTTIAEVKSNIIALAKDADNWHVSHLPCDYVTTDDIFISDAAKELRAYLAPSEANVFAHTIHVGTDGTGATYTRIINGFRTDEIIVIDNSSEGGSGSVSRKGEAYTPDDLSRVPDIGEALENMELSQWQPPHIEILDGMRFKYARAEGVYRKVGGKVYGILRILWSYTYPEGMIGYVNDDCYYLYDENGNGSVVEREELKELLGDDPIILRFSYELYQ